MHKWEGQRKGGEGRRREGRKRKEGKESKGEKRREGREESKGGKERKRERTKERGKGKREKKGERERKKSKRKRGREGREGVKEASPSRCPSMAPARCSWVPTATGLGVQSPVLGWPAGTGHCPLLGAEPGSVLGAEASDLHPLCKMWGFCCIPSFCWPSS